MNGLRISVLALACLLLPGCVGPHTRGTLAELANVQPDLRDTQVDDGLARAAESYRRYLRETEESPLTPEAMRRLADLEVEQAYGILGHGGPLEMSAPETAKKRVQPATNAPAPKASASLDDLEFEETAPSRGQLPAQSIEYDAVLPGGESQVVTGGPEEAIKIYREILTKYPHYERNDQVLYQMCRAYDELGRVDEAIDVMERLMREYPYSKYVAEIEFRRGEYAFVRKQYLDAEDAYRAIVAMGPSSSSSYYELALYKLGWTLYKQELYEDALGQFIAMLDYRLASGFDFDKPLSTDDEHRVADTFRVISLSFSNLGGPDVVDNYFAQHGDRRYADKIYSNLGEFYFAKLRYDDAASVYKSFMRQYPFHRQSPHFSMRVIEIYGAGGFPRLVVESKKEFARNYARNAEFWTHFAMEDLPEVVGFLKQNLTDLANHYHALYQDAQKVNPAIAPESFAEASHWYREFLSSFPAEEESPKINYQLADLLLENHNYVEAAREYERTAYDYTPHDQSAAAGYAAVYAYRQELENAPEARQRDLKEVTVKSSLRFAETFPAHEEAPVVLGAAADDLYAMNQFVAARDAARSLIDRYPDSKASLRREAWAVIANASMDLSEFAVAEPAYQRLLALTPEDDGKRTEIVDGLAASIYKQGEEAAAAEDYRTAATHYLRIKDLAPTSEIRKGAQYDGAAMLVKLGAWSEAAEVLEDFRQRYPKHELSREVTRQLAQVYREAGRIEQSAHEHERMAAEAAPEEAELSRAALLTAGELYDQQNDLDEAVRVYEQYVAAWPRPLDIAMETRSRLAKIWKERGDDKQYKAELRQLVRSDAEAGADRTDRSRYLAGVAALGLADEAFDSFASYPLKQPFKKSLAEKQRRMDKAIDSFERLAQYEVAEVTAGATYFIAEIYYQFSSALTDSERPSGMSGSELNEYEMAIEEEAYPFEERAIQVHEQNVELLRGGVYNPYVQKSLDRLGTLMPGRYAKHELSGGFLGSIDRYAYRMPGAGPAGEENAGRDEVTDETPEVTSIETMAKAPATIDNPAWAGVEP